MTWKTPSAGRQRLRIGADVHCEERVKARGIWGYLRDRSPGEVPARDCAKHSNPEEAGPYDWGGGHMDPVPCGPADVPRSGLRLSSPSHLVIRMLTVTDAATSMAFQLGKLGSRQNSLVLRTEPACPLWAGV